MLQALAFSADGLWLVSVSSGKASNVVVWDIASHTPVAIGSSENPRPVVYFLPNAPTYRFVTTTPNTLVVWELHVDSLTQTVISLEDCLAKDDSVLCWTTSFPEVVIGISSVGQLIAYQKGKLTSLETQITSDETVSIFVDCLHLVLGSRNGQLQILKH